MQYLGGKSRVAKQISEVILSSANERSRYVEPFIGGGSVAEQMTRHFQRSYLSDASPDLIVLWRALQDGWKPPEFVSEEEYQMQRGAPVTPMRAFVGYGCSFGGKWFAGYARQKGTDSYARFARNALLRQSKAIGRAMIYQAHYQNVLIYPQSVVYLDPPYANTTGYARTGSFDNAAFWRWAERVSGRASVFVSEYSAPDGWVSVWEGSPYASLRSENRTTHAIEKLWVYGHAHSIARAA